jgi:hypothetical protein
MIELAGLLRPSQKNTKLNVCALGADSAKTVTRAMKHFGLNVKAWPPSTWPEQDPRRGDTV